MRFFASQILKPYITSHGYKNLLEIGSSYGQNADQILRGPEGVSINIIDPCLDRNLMEKYQNNSRVKLHRGLSVDVLPVLKGQYDCILIDGDHNWYTVYNELSLIEKGNLLKPGGTIFLHDVAWPYARRDMYHNLETIPAEYKFPSSLEGVARGVSQPVAGGFNAGVYKALHEGGPRNGVLTAVEDFLRGKKQYAYFASKSQYGLGIIVRKDENYLPKMMRWYFNVRVFDVKTVFRPITKKIGAALKTGTA